MFGEIRNLHNITGEIEAELPNGKLYEFNGKFRATGGDIDIDFGLTAENILLRGSVLKGTDHVVGLVVYAGKDTKVMMN